MGGRGSSFGTETIQAMDGPGNSTSEPLIVAGMTPTDRGSHYTNEGKTLAFIEGRKKEYKKEQLQVIDEYGYVTRAFQGDQHSVGIDADTAAYMKGKTVTHNHPDAYGGTFSSADIGTLRSGMKELRASAREGVYSMRAAAGADPEGLYQAYQKDSERLQERMSGISKQMAEKKWSSYRQYRIQNRKAQLEVVHKWYGQHAAKHGYEYRFTPYAET